MTMKEKYIAEIARHIPLLSIAGQTHEQIADRVYYIVDVAKQTVDMRENEALCQRKLDQARRNQELQNDK